MKGKTAMTATERSRLLRKRQKAEGYRLIQVTLDPQTATTLDTLRQQTGWTQSWIISQALEQFNKTFA